MNYRKLVRKKRLELSRVAPLEPKSSASTNSATFAGTANSPFSAKLCIILQYVIMNYISRFDAGVVLIWPLFTCGIVHCPEKEATRRSPARTNLLLPAASRVRKLTRSIRVRHGQAAQITFEKLFWDCLESI